MQKILIIKPLWGGGVNLPNVSYCRKENEVHYNPLILQPNNEIWYTSTDGNIVEPFSDSTAPFLDVNGNNIPIISNTYKNGKGIIKLQKDCYQIGVEAFFDCTSLKSITIPDSVTTIKDSAFFGCSSLTGITIPDSVTSIGARAFYNCSSLTGITIPDSVTSIGNNAFRFCILLIDITIPDSVTSIGYGAFSAWTGATSTDIINFPNEQLKIKYFENGEAFSEWKSLTSVTIPDKVTSIGAGAFRTCSKLIAIKLPENVTSIGMRAFAYCSELTDITVLRETPPTLGTNAFDDIASNAVIYVPSGSVYDYKFATNWSRYANKIHAIP